MSQTSYQAALPRDVLRHTQELVWLMSGYEVRRSYQAALPRDVVLKIQYSFILARLMLKVNPYERD